MFMKRKLNTCAHCDCKVTKMVFSTDGHMYFICKLHWLLLQTLIEAEEKVYERIEEIKAAESRMKAHIARLSAET